MFINQTWFWALLIPALVTLVSLWITREYKIKLERIKLWESEKFKVYNELYKFISNGYLIWPPSDPRMDYIGLMKGGYLKKIKQNMLLYQPEIRELLKSMETQYYALSDPSIYNCKPFDEFFSHDYFDTLLKIENLIEKNIDEMLNKTSFKWIHLFQNRH